MVYFIESQGFTKIGYTKDEKSLIKRIDNLNCGNPFGLSLKFFIDGYDYEEENMLHKYFKKYKVKNEWFCFDFDFKKNDVPIFIEKQKQKEKRNKKISSEKRTDVVKEKNKLKIENVVNDMLSKNKFIKIKDITHLTGLGIKSVNRNLSKEKRDEIEKNNIKNFGYKNMNEFIKGNNIIAVEEAANELISKNEKIKAITISKMTGIHRVTVSKIINERKLKLK